MCKRRSYSNCISTGGDQISTAWTVGHSSHSYDRNIVADGIQDTTFNSTRFICISKDLEIYPDANKFSVMLSIPHRPGSLAAIISKFAAIDVNLTKIEARALPGMDFEYLFTFDFTASPSDPNVLSLLSELSQDPEVERFSFLGAYAEK